MTRVYGKTENLTTSKYKTAKDIQTPPRIYDYVAELTCCAKSKQNRLMQFCRGNRGSLSFSLRTHTHTHLYSALEALHNVLYKFKTYLLTLSTDFLHMHSIIYNWMLTDCNCKCNASIHCGRRRRKNRWIDSMHHYRKNKLKITRREDAVNQPTGKEEEPKWPTRKER